MAYTNADQFVHNWIIALRSNRYPQGVGWLRQPQGFCCLGVACDVWDPNHWIESETCAIYSLEGDVESDVTLALPDDITRLLGPEPEEDPDGDELIHEVPVPRAIAERYVSNHVMAEVDNAIADDSSVVTLSTLNDKGATFKEIANVIEAWWFPEEEETTS